MNIDNSLRYTNRLTFFDHIGYTELHNEKEKVELKIVITPKLLLDNGSVPAGIFATMLDIVIGATISNVCDSFATTINLNITFFDLSNKGEYTSRSTIIHQGEKSVTGEGIVLDNENNIVAKAIETFKVKTKQ